MMSLHVLVAVFTLVCALIVLLDQLWWRKNRPQGAKPAVIGYAQLFLPWLLVVLLIQHVPIDLLFLVTALTLACALIVLLDQLWWRKTRPQTTKPAVIAYARQLFPVFLAVLLIRCYGMQIVQVPTGSLEPTLMPGDFVLVTQYDYGLRLPLVNTPIVPVSKPQRGDIVVFKWPVNRSVLFVKRVVGLPGDRIDYINHTFVINGVPIEQTVVGHAIDNKDDPDNSWPVTILEEDLLGTRHTIYLCADTRFCPSQKEDFYHLVVPQDAYFMVGDNRDNSEDSRIWGFVSDQDLVGKARFVLFNGHHFMWSRIGTHL